MKCITKIKIIYTVSDFIFLKNSKKYEAWKMFYYVIKTTL